LRPAHGAVSCAHKPGGKAIKHPDRGKQSKPPPPSPEEEAELAFDDAYTIPFHKKFPEPPHHAGYPLGPISAAAFAFSGGAPVISPVSKATMFGQFTEPIGDPDVDDEPPTLADAEAALAFLIEQGMVEVDGEEISVPARFLAESTATD
jgi:hypothetical protein